MPERHPADILDLLASYREEYARGAYDHDIALQVGTLRDAARILRGQSDAAMGLLPSWRWNEWSAWSGMDMSLPGTTRVS